MTNSCSNKPRDSREERQETAMKKTNKQTRNISNTYTKGSSENWLKDTESCSPRLDNMNSSAVQDTLLD